MKFKSYELCTHDANGKMSVSYTIDSFWRELFNFQTTFTFTADKIGLEVVGYRYTNLGKTLTWFDENNQIVKNKRILDNISKIIYTIEIKEGLHTRG